MSRMQRTQIYLDPEVSAELDRLARTRGTSRAMLIRLAARRYLDQQRGGDDAILGVIGLGGGEGGRVSEEHDRVLTDQAQGTVSQ